jgi:hypothetical protein
MSLRSKILEVDDLKREPFPCPEWPEADGQLFVRGLTAEESVKLNEHTDDLMPWVASCVVLDEDGERVFEDGDVADLATKSPAVLNRITSATYRLSKLTDDTQGELEKN